jgi:hypothetical protein
MARFVVGVIKLDLEFFIIRKFDFAFTLKKKN